MAYVDGVLDVGVLVPVCFENPLKRESIAFLAEVLEQRRRAFIPVTSVLGAYHITTRYLGIPRVSVNRMLREVLTSGSAALYPELSPTVAADALDYASTYGIESWDGYLISLARSLGRSIVYSLDEELAKVAEITVVNPFRKENVRKYHSFIEGRLKRAKNC